MLLLAPIFEADLQPEQYAYRPERSANDAVKRLHVLLNRGHDEVVDREISHYYAELKNARLMKSIARRVSDGCMLGLIKAWLEMPVEGTPIIPHGDGYRWSDVESGVIDTKCSSADLDAHGRSSWVRDWGWPATRPTFIVLAVTRRQCAWISRRPRTPGMPMPGMR